MGSSSNDNKRELKSILFADVAGYTRLMHDNEEGTYNRIRELVELFEQGCKEYDGEILEVRGDGIFALFASAVNSVQFADKTQRIVEERNVEIDEAQKIRFRVGIHLGDVVRRANQHFGDSINIASRIEGLADAGGICISNAVYQQVKHVRKLGYEYLGPKQLKNITEDVDVYRITQNPSAAVMVASPREVAKFAPNTDEVHKPSVIVIPLRNMGDHSDGYFADGVSEDIITRLSKFQNLMVIGRTTAFAYKSTTLTAAQISRQINVQYIVSGSIRTSRNRARITVELLDAHRENTLWSEHYDRNIDDIFDIQDEISEIVSAATAVKIESETARLAMSRPNDLLAYDCLLQGQQHIFRYTKNDNYTARELYDKAAHRDPRYARALAAMSRTHNLDWRYAWSEESDHALQQAMQLAKNAVELDAHDARGLSELAYTYLYSKLHDLSIATYEKAIAINPNDPDILSDMADALVHSGEPAKAVNVMGKAMRLNPFYPDQYLWHLSSAQFSLKQYENVIQTVNKANNPTEGERLLAASYAYLGEQKKAEWYSNKVLEAHPNFSLEHWRQILPDKYEEDTNHYIEGLRKAGLK